MINGKKPRMIEGRLLADGLLGIGRKLNYTGDIMIWFGFALSQGTMSIYPYVLFGIITTGLFYRAWEDD